MKRKAILYQSGASWSKGTLPSLLRPLNRKEQKTIGNQEPDDFVPRLDSIDSDDPPGILAQDAPPEELPSKEWR